MIIFAGQSNIAGQTSLVPEDLRPVAGAMEYKLNKRDFSPLEHPVGEDILPHFCGASFGLGNMVPDFVDVYRKYRRVLVSAVHAAQGDTTIDEWAPSTERYAKLVEKINAASKSCPPEPLEHKFSYGFRANRTPSADCPRMNTTKSSSHSRTH